MDNVDWDWIAGWLAVALFLALGAAVAVLIWLRYDCYYC